MPTLERTHLINGGAPAGISIRPGDDGCRTKRISIRIITISGNNNTAPKGRDIFELPFNRMRFLEKAKPGSMCSLLKARSSSEGKSGGEGARLASFCIHPMCVGKEANTLQGEGAKCFRSPREKKNERLLRV